MPISTIVSPTLFTTPYTTTHAFSNPGNAIDGNSATFAQDFSLGAIEADVLYKEAPGLVGPFTLVLVGVSLDYAVEQVTNPPPVSTPWSVTVINTGQVLDSGVVTRARAVTVYRIQPMTWATDTVGIRFYKPPITNNVQLTMKIYEVLFMYKTHYAPVRIDG